MWKPKPGLPERLAGVVPVLTLALLLGLGPGLPAMAQDGTAPGGGDEAAGAPAEGDEATAEEVAAEDDLPDIDAILEGDDAVLGGGGFTYDPGDRRDPFKSLLRAREEPGPQGPRPEGIPGLLIDEIIISGIFRTSEGWVAQVQSAEKDKSYLIRIGDQLYDGDVTSMSRNEVVFKQIVEDQAALKPFREVVKKLNP